MNKKLVYTTYGENLGTVYQTQVIELLNYWSKRNNWKICLIQIADQPNFEGLNTSIERIYIPRKSKLLLKNHILDYINTIDSKLNLRDNDLIYFSSRVYFAYDIISEYIKRYSVKHEINNLDVRGISEEFKYTTKFPLVYYVLDRFYKKTIRGAESVTVVSSNLKKYLIRKYNIDSDKIHVVPTLSIMNYVTINSEKKDIAYIGKIAWISKRKFLEEANILLKELENLNWKLNFFGTPDVYKELRDKNIRIYNRMSPQELYENLVTYHSGLILRDKSLVNQVAAPTKISDYLCLGIPVIYSGEIGSINDFIEFYPQANKFLVSIQEISSDEDRMRKFISIKEEEREYLSRIACKYFHVSSVIDRYIDVYNVQSN